MLNDDDEGVGREGLRASDAGATTATFETPIRCGVADIALRCSVQ
jgi:hypothetical protein